MTVIPLTTVIGSYPVSIEPHAIMDDYFEGKQACWQRYIQEAVEAMVGAGVSMVSDGQTRDPFTTIFLRKIGGVRIRDRPEVIEPVSYQLPITRSDYQFVRGILPKKTKLVATLAGPFTLMKSCIDHVYHNEEELAFALAKVLQKEAETLQPFVDMISVDEPFFSVETPSYMKELLATVVKQIAIPTRLHVCGDVSTIIPQLLDVPVKVLSHEFKAMPHLLDAFQQHSCSKQVCLGAVRSDNAAVESVEEIVLHIRKGQEVFGDKLVQLAPDCGQRFLTKEVAFQKLRHLVQAWRMVYG